MTLEPQSPLVRLLTIMARLRNPETGCEWDREQTFATIAPYTVEEAYEVADAIDRQDMEALKDELGDLLLQVVFHARMAEEAQHFQFADVANSISDKLEARHPHIFGIERAKDESQADRWERIKADEREARGATSALDGIALTLPALMRAEKLQKRAARLGFDWPDAEAPKAKLQEELEELAGAQNDQERLMEAGDVLFSAVNIVRALGVAPEEALRAANAKFETRFRHMEQAAMKAGNPLASLPLDEQELYWQAAKASES
ncbi:MAG: nucleoside triphosphate pyrophosphohydrolase [Novosphingobium sp.]|nr:nucleoside triphosphate pyrophosphohydrolase [Novosphingobium sp.]